jgi:hypothetical protein
MEFYERVSGARMHAAFYRPNDIDLTGLNYQFFLDVLDVGVNFLIISLKINFNHIFYKNISIF